MRPGSSLRRWILLATSVLVGCDGGSDEPSTTLASFALEEELRIDGHEHDLVSIGWMGVGPDGTIALLQGQDYGVRFIGEDGADLGLVGGRGEGPGEFMRPIRAGWLADTLWVSDTQLDRVTLISPEREVVRTLPPMVSVYPAPEDEARFPVFTYAYPYALYPGGDQLVSVIATGGDPRAEAFGGSGYVRVSSEGLIRHLVIMSPRAEGGSVFVTFDGGSASRVVPFFARPLRAIQSDGGRLATLLTQVQGSQGGTFEVTTMDADGKEAFRRAFPFEGVTIPGRVADSAMSAMMSRDGPPEMARALRTQLPDLMPPVYPPVTDLVLGDDGSVWIGLRRTEEGRPWLILDAVGEPVGEVLLPLNTALRVADATHIWATETDDLDVQSVVRYRRR